MKKLLLLPVFCLLISHYNANAQIVVFSQNKCYLDKVGDLIKSVEEFGEFANAQVDNGNLSNWGVLTHNWGDEWNYNVYYSAESLQKFQTAFGEIIKNYSEKYPDGMKKFQESCFEHKDSIYSSAYAYDGSNADE